MFTPCRMLLIAKLCLYEHMDVPLISDPYAWSILLT